MKSYFIALLESLICMLGCVPVNGSLHVSGLYCILFWSMTVVVVIVLYSGMCSACHDEKKGGRGGGGTKGWKRGHAKQPCEQSCLPSEKGAQSRLLLKQCDSKCKWMNAKGHKDKEKETERE